MNIELRATRTISDEDEPTGSQIIYCDESEAEQFSVYICDPYAEWIADFRSYNDARNWAEEVADCHECELIDFVEKEHERAAA